VNKKCFLLTVAALLLCGAVIAQTRQDTTIYVPVPMGGTGEQQAFMKEQFSMEATAAGYAIVDSARESDYTLQLRINPNVIVYSDGSTGDPGPDEKHFIVELHLLQTANNEELVAFSFPFTDLVEMYEWTLYLLYQATANIPLTKYTAIIDTEHWRNKWLYIRFSFDYALVDYSPDAAKNTTYSIPTGNTSSGSANSVGIPINRIDSFMPGAVLGIELQFVDFSPRISMAAEADIKLLFGDPSGATLIPTIALSIKVPIKPSKHWMVEPYVMADFPVSTSQSVIEFPRVGVGGGVQIAAKGGEMGGFFADFNAVYNIGNVHTENMSNSFSPKEVYWKRFVVEVGVGYKLGFFNRREE
jgi:hypothetical protein